jgi:hypothetical protein
MIYLWIVLGFIGYTVMGTAVGTAIDYSFPGTAETPRDRFVLGALWPLVLVSLPAVGTRIFLKWAQHRHQLAWLAREAAAREASASSVQDL